MYNSGSYAPRSKRVVLEPPMNQNPNWYRTYDHWSKGHGAANSWRATYLIYRGSGHTVVTCKRKNGNVNTRPWRTPGMVCYHCNKPGYTARACRLRNNPSGDIPVDPKGKIDVETIQAYMDKTWKNKSKEKPQDVPISAPNVEIPEPKN